mgnify:FL=1
MLKYPSFLIMTSRRKYIKIYLWGRPKLKFSPHKWILKRYLPIKPRLPAFKSTHWRGFVVLIGLALPIAWFVSGLEKDYSPPSETKSQIPDYTLENFKTFHMDEQGLVTNQLAAATLAHYPDTNTKLTEPSMVFYKEKQPTWTVRAKQGEVSPDGNQVWLFGQTTLQQHTQNSQPAVEIISQDVWVQLDTEYAETKAPTTIINSKGQTHSVGMRVFMPSQQVELLSKVRGHYVP